MSDEYRPLLGGTPLRTETVEGIEPIKGETVSVVTFDCAIGTFAIAYADGSIKINSEYNPQDDHGKILVGLLRDAARFRWLVSNYPDAVAMIPEVMLRRPHDEVEAIARAAIDAAMQEDEQ